MKNVLYPALNDKIANNKLFYPRKEIFHLIFLTIFQNTYNNNIEIPFNDENYTEFDNELQNYAQIGSIMTIAGIKVNFNNYVIQYLDKKLNYSQIADKILKIQNKWMYQTIGFKFDLINNKIIYDSDEIKDKLLSNNNGYLSYSQSLIKEYFLGNIDARTIYSDINMTFMAGIETTGNSMDYILCSLAKYTKIQNEIYNELIKITNNNTIDLGIKDLNKCNKLRMFIHECIRLSSIVATSVPRVLIKAIQYKNYILPKNSTIMLNMKACNVHCDSWDDDNDKNKINLSYWMDENGNFKYNKNLMSFGVGLRECAGKSVALKSLLYYTANIILNYKINGPNNNNNFEISQSKHIVRLVEPQIGLKISKRN